MVAGSVEGTMDVIRSDGKPQLESKNLVDDNWRWGDWSEKGIWWDLGWFPVMENPNLVPSRPDREAVVDEEDDDQLRRGSP